MLVWIIVNLGSLHVCLPEASLWDYSSKHPRVHEQVLSDLVLTRVYMVMCRIYSPELSLQAVLTSIYDRRLQLRQVSICFGI